MNGRTNAGKKPVSFPAIARTEFVLAAVEYKKQRTKISKTVFLREVKQTTGNSCAVCIILTCSKFYYIFREQTQIIEKS